MTPQQLKFYRWSASEAKKGMEATRTKMTTREWTEERYNIHVQAGAIDGDGNAKSSVALTNAELDQVLALFFTWSHAGSLNLQLEQIAQPGIRCRYLADDLLDRISAILESSGREKQAVKRGPGRDGYLLHMARRLSGNPDLYLDDCDQPTWSKIIAALRIRYNQVQGKTTGREARRARPFDRPTERPQDRREIIQPTLDLDDNDPF